MGLFRSTSLSLINVFNCSSPIFLVFSTVFTTVLSVISFEWIAMSSPPSSENEFSVSSKEDTKWKGHLEIHSGILDFPDDVHER